MNGLRNNFLIKNEMDVDMKKPKEGLEGENLEELAKITEKRLKEYKDYLKKYLK